MSSKVPVHGGDDDVLSLCVLITREDYLQYAAQLRREQRRGHLPFITGGGAVLVFLGLAGLFFGSAISLAPSVAAGMLLVGAFLIGYDGLFAPLLDKGAAAREFDEKPELGMAGTYRFTPDGVEIRNGRIEGTLPRAQVTSAAETQSLFSIAFGREVRILIPKRLLGEGRMPAAAGLALLREERGIIWIRHIHSRPLWNQAGILPFLPI